MLKFTLKRFHIFIFITVLLSCNNDNANESNDLQEVEICNDSTDNDGDGLTDCEDPDCNDNANCEEICNDGIDNDGDGFIDCSDLDCEDFPDCLIERCIDGVDNDGDGLVDCDDPDCDDNPNCQ
ncbi:S8/S53 family peptidase [Winogradskyella algicola]|uniref:hypothetical protein n=1 Tax=Winogradskyella algicola TaxID=2575815 RepID=UPI001107C090|nr:hypothetical protein [Winogradskyella algicola]